MVVFVLSGAITRRAQTKGEFHGNLHFVYGFASAQREEILFIGKFIAHTIYS